MDTYRRTGKRKKQISLDGGLMRFFLPYWIMAAVVLLILYFLIALMYMFTPLGAAALPFFSRTVSVLVLTVFSAMVGHETREGIVSGGFFGLVLTLFILVLGMILRAVSLFSLLFLVLLVTGVLFGCLGGIIGCGKRKKRRRIR